MLKISLLKTFLVAASIALTAVLASVGAPGTNAQEPAPAADNWDMQVVLFDNFFVSLVAASTCDKPDERTMGMFVRNLLIVQETTVAHFQTQLPDKSVNEIRAILNARAEQIDRGIKQSIGSKSCADSEIIKLVGMFDTYARMDLLGEGKAR